MPEPNPNPKQNLPINTVLKHALQDLFIYLFGVFRQAGPFQLQS